MKKLFVALQAVIYIAFIYGDFSQSYPTKLIKLGCIILCALYSIYLLAIRRSSRRWLFVLTRMLTVAGDYYLTVTSHNYLLGVALFAATEVIYGLMLTNRRMLPWRLVSTLILAGAVEAFSHFNHTYGLAAVSLVNLIFNIIDAAMLRKPLLTWGFILFLLCDVSVGMCNLDILARITYYSSWIFYLPSQVLLCLGVNAYEEE